MTINLKDYEGKLVVATLRNEWMIVSLVYKNGGDEYDYKCFPYSIDGKNYSNDGRVLITAESPHDIVDIALAEEDACETPEPVITRVEVITDTGRDYVRWNKNNVITTSLQDGGKTLKVFVNTTKEPEMPITKPEFYGNLRSGDKTLYRVAEEEVSKQWATALSGLIDKLGGDSPALWEWKGITPTPEKVVECLQELVDFHMSIAADNELEACVEWLGDAPVVWDNDIEMHPGYHLRLARRPKPTLKSQALKDFETVRKHSDLLPEILDTIEKALKSLPE